MGEDDTSTSNGGVGPVSLDKVFELLADRRRRYVLYTLRDVEHFELEELAKVVAARENDVSPDEIPSEQVNHVAVALHHRTLPKLQHARLVDYDERHGDVCSGANLSLVEKYLDMAAADEPGEEPSDAT